MAEFNTCKSKVMKKVIGLALRTVHRRLIDLGREVEEIKLDIQMLA